MADVIVLGIAIDPSDAKAGAEAVKRELEKIGVTSERTSSKVKDSGVKIGSVYRNVAGLLATVGITKFFADASKAAIEFEKSISNLSAITGATGKDLKFLEQQARDMGATTTFSAAQAAEAFKLIASAKPDLLESTEALSQVTREVLTLAEAAGVSLPESAIVLGTSLNQFGAGADQAARFINVLAAGAKFGASEIESTAAALKNAGTIANTVGASFEDTSTAIQLLANSGIKAEEAGTALKNIFLNLERSTNDQFKPSIVGLDQAIQNLRDANLSLVDLNELVGQRAVGATQSLINQADAFATLKGRLTDTNTAYDQAVINTSNLDGDLKRLSSTMDEVKLRLIGNSEGSRQLVQSFDRLVQIFFDLDSEADNASSKFEFLQGTMQNITKVLIGVNFAIENVGKNWGALAAAIAAGLRGEFSLAKEIFDLRKEDLKTSALAAADQLAKVDALDQELQKRKEIEAAAAASIGGGGEKTKGGDEGEETGGGDTVLAFDQDAAADNFEKIRESLLSQTEAEKEFYAERLAQIAQYRQLKNADQELANKIEMNETKRHEDTLKKIEEEASKKRIQQAEQERRAKIASAQQVFGQISTLMNSESKKLFRIGQAAAIANATISGYEAAVHSYNFGARFGGPPLGAAMAALSIAATGAQIQAIASQSPNGGGGVSSAGIGGGGGGVVTANVAANATGVGGTNFLDVSEAFRTDDEGGGGQPVVINFNGDVSGLGDPSDIINTIKDQVNQGDFVLIEPTSRNGQELAGATV